MLRHSWESDVWIIKFDWLSHDSSRKASETFFFFSQSLLSSSISSQELPIRLHSPPHTDSISFLLQLLLHLSDSSHNVCSFHSKSANSYTYKRCECKGGLWELALVSSSAFTAESFRSTGESSTCTVSFTTCLFTADTETEAK